jgi:hypothetical protein
MELEFDKEIDSLLRKTGGADRGVLVGDKPADKPKLHLDADEFSAFAENVLPTKARALHMAHLADCDRCRRILTGLISLNAESVDESVGAPAIVPVASVEPWYRRLLLPNLAYVMGGLVLIFGGLITFSLLQSSVGENATISQSVANTTSARGPMEVADEMQSTEMTSNSNAASAVANKPLINSNAAASDSSLSANSAPSGSTLGQAKERDAVPADDDRAKLAIDGADAKAPAAAPAAAAPPPPAAKPEANEAITSKAAEPSREEAKARSVSEKKKDVEDEKADTALAARQVEDVARSQAGGVAKSTPGPSRNTRQNFPNRADNTYEMYEEKRLGGRTFQRRDNVWYDRAYRGQATKNVRRNTDEYRELDSGLRLIAESLNGVVVVVWEKKAYRIQ